MAAVTGAFSASAQSAALDLDSPGNMGMPFNVSLWGTFVASVALQRSFDGGTTWLPVTYPDGTAVTFTTPVSTSWEESEGGVSYRLACTWTSGTANYRLSQ